MSPIDPSIPGADRGRGLDSTHQRTSVNGTNRGRIISTGRNGPSTGNGSRREQGNATIHSVGENATTNRNCNRNNGIIGEASIGNNNGCNNNRSLHSQQRAGRWRAAGRTTQSARQRIRKFKKGSKKFKQKISASQAQLSALTEEEAAVQSSKHAVDMIGLPSADSIYAARTDEERMVKDVVSQWEKGGHGYVPDSKPDDVLRLTMENANSLSLFSPEQWKTKKLQNLNNKYEADATLLNETGTNWNMAPIGKKLDGLSFSLYRLCLVIVILFLLSHWVPPQA